MTILLFEQAALGARAGAMPGPQEFN